MSEEKTENVEQKIEVETQLQQSAEYAKEQEQKAADILPEKAPVVETQPEVTQGTVEPNSNGNQPGLHEALSPEPLKPRFESIEPFSKKTGCPECGKAGWKSEFALKAHIRFAHELPAKKAAAAKQQAELEAKPPDFSDITDQPAPVRPEASPLLRRYETMANMTFDMSTGMLARIFGPEWNPTSVDERSAVVLAIQKYYESVQLPDIPPGYMLCFVCAAYAAPRLAQQPTKTKLQQAWLWLKLKFSRKGSGNRAGFLNKNETK